MFIVRIPNGGPSEAQIRCRIFEKSTLLELDLSKFNAPHLRVLRAAKEIHFGALISAPHPDQNSGYTATTSKPESSRGL